MAGIRTAQVKSIIGKAERKYGNFEAIGISTGSAWDGPSAIEEGENCYRVVACRSELEMREALADRGDDRVLILTSLKTADIGNDLAVRLAKGELLVCDAWTSVRDLFEARAVDGATLGRHPWIAAALLDTAPPEGYPPVPAGVLTGDIAWEQLLRYMLGIESGRPDLGMLVRWAAQPSNARRLFELDGEIAEDVAVRLVDCAGPPAGMVCQYITAGHGDRLLPLACAGEVVFGVNDQTTRDASIRMETFTGGNPLVRNVAQVLAEEAIRYCRNVIKTNPSFLNTIEAQTDEVLDHLGLMKYAHLSSVSRTGCEQRLEAFGKTIQSFLRKATPKAIGKIENAQKRLQSHLDFDCAPERLERAEMATRLCRYLWLNRSQPELAELGHAAARYVEEGSFVDRAWQVLHEAEMNEALSGAFSAIIDGVNEKRMAFAKVFAGMMQDWVKSGSSEVDAILLEQVVKDVVAPIAAKQPVLLITLDGMSYPVYRELHEDLAGRGWEELAMDDEWPKAVLPPLPTVTEICRRSFFCGKLTGDSGDDEAKGFAAIPALKAVCGSVAPPLYLKGKLTQPGSAQLSSSLRKSLLDPKTKAVGVIINVIDDLLYKGDQFKFRWKVDQIPVLANILAAAREAKRVVVIVSDHGHVLDHHSNLREYEAGERYRPDDGDVGEGEMVFEGSRVLKPADGRVILPWHDDVRYKKHRKFGYHGGVTPQEAVIPLSIWATEATCGLKPMPFSRPKWWDEGDLTMPTDSDEEDKLVRVEQEFAAMPLFAASSGSWTDRLAASEALAHQLTFVRPPIEPGKVAAFCGLLEQHGGRLPRTALAQQLKLPLPRLRGYVSTLQRVLNLEGYTVLTHDADTDMICLDIELLKTQFEV